MTPPTDGARGYCNERDSLRARLEAAVGLLHEVKWYLPPRIAAKVDDFMTPTPSVERGGEDAIHSDTASDKNNDRAAQPKIAANVEEVALTILHALRFFEPPPLDIYAARIIAFDLLQNCRVDVAPTPPPADAATKRTGEAERHDLALRFALAVVGNPAWYESAVKESHADGPGLALQAAARGFNLADTFIRFRDEDRDEVRGARGGKA